MAHFARLDENNVVTEVLVVDNNDVGNLPFPDSEPFGVMFLNSFLPFANWKQTSYNNNFRFNYAGIGYTFHPECGEHGGFAIPPKYEYFIFDVSSCSWVPPVPYPNDGNDYYWSDFGRSWIKIPTLTILE